MDFKTESPLQSVGTRVANPITGIQTQCYLSVGIIDQSIQHHFEYRFIANPYPIRGPNLPVVTS